MNKKVLVAAVGAALVAGPIAAQAGATVYGHAHMSLDVLSADRTVNQIDSSNQVVSNSSRIGIKADEDLGGGLKAEVKYELLFITGDAQNMRGLETTNSFLQTNRDNYIGLSGGFGALRLGVIDSATKDAGGVADLFYREQLGESRAIINQSNGLDGRIENGIHYFSPSLGGWTIKAQYGHRQEDNIGSPTTVTTGVQERIDLAVGAKGKIGPVNLGIAYLSRDGDPASATSVDQSAIRVGAKMNMGGFDIAALYQTVSDRGNTSGADVDTYGVGVGFKMGSNYLKAQYYIADDVGSAANSGASQLSLGWDYLASKTTTLYAVYAKVDNDSGTSAYSVGSNGHGTTASTNVNGGSASGFSLGMIVNF